MEAEEIHDGGVPMIGTGTAINGMIKARHVWEQDDDRHDQRDRSSSMWTTLSIDARTNCVVS